MHAPVQSYAAPWPPDDTEESVLGTHLHQTTITNLRLGLNEAAAGSGGPAPWQAGGQTLITGFRRLDGSRYAVLPDVFVYRRPLDLRRPSLALRRDGPPALALEVLSESTAESDLDLEQGKGYSYARGGVAEYLVLDPTGEYLPEGRQGQGWRLDAGVYVPWEPDAEGRWASEQIGVAFGFEGLWAVVYGPDGRPIPREGEVLRTLARGRAEGERLGRAEGERLGRAEGLQAALLRLLTARFGPPPPVPAARLASTDDLDLLQSLVDTALAAPSLDAFVEALDRATRGR